MGVVSRMCYLRPMEFISRKPANTAIPVIGHSLSSGLFPPQIPSPAGAHSAPPSRCLLKQKVGFRGVAPLRGTFTNLVIVYLLETKVLGAHSPAANNTVTTASRVISGKSLILTELVVGRLITELERSPDGDQYVWTLTKPVPTPLFSYFP